MMDIPKNSRLNTLLRFNTALQHSAWFRSYWFRLFYIGIVFLAIVTGLVTSAPLTYVFGQIVLASSVYVSLSILADRPLINPIQTVVILFYWWFGVGPIVIALVAYLQGNQEVAWKAQESGMEAFWVVSPGLIFYAIVARLSLHWLSLAGYHARFLMPVEVNYRPMVIFIYLSLMCISSIIIAVLEFVGIKGMEEVNFLGGTKTNIWWVGIIMAIGSIDPIVKSALMKALSLPWKILPWYYIVMSLFVVLNTIIFALFGGWKSPIVFLAAYYVCAYISYHQRIPWLILIGGLLVFLTVITPFVSYGRNVAIRTGADNSETRKQVFQELLKDPATFIPETMESLDVSVFFRGIYPLAGELTRRNSLFRGEWNGETIIWGLETLVPRLFMPNKRDSDIGNYFSQMVGVDIGVSNEDDRLNNVAISIPFEFVGNFGWCAGIMAFGMMGFFWTLLCGWLLSSARLSDHPLSPFLILSTMMIESPLGSFLAGLRNLCVPLVFCFIIYKLLKGKI